MAGRYDYLVSRYLNQITVRMGGAVGCHGYLKGLTFNLAIFPELSIYMENHQKKFNLQIWPRAMQFIL